MKEIKAEVIQRRKELLHKLIFTEDNTILDILEEEINSYDILLNIIRREEERLVDDKLDSITTSINNAIQELQLFKSQLFSLN
jgi:predicted nucleotide-binding protein